MLTIKEVSLLKQQFESRGYYICKGLLSAEVVQSVRSEMEAIVDFLADWLVTRELIKDPMKEEPFETRIAKLYHDNLDEAPKNLRHFLNRSGLFDLFFNAELLDLVEEILGPEIRLYPNYSARPKLPDWEGTLVLWHQDGGYTDSMSGQNGSADQLRMVNVWSPLVPTRVENGCMQFIPGTHKLGIVPHVSKKHYLEIADDHLKPRLKYAVNIEVDPGDVVLFHNLLFHCGLPNKSKTVRWSLDWRYQDATQPTMRTENGHLARSRNNPAAVVQSASQWARLTLN